MKTIRSISVFLFVFLATISILIDWTEHSITNVSDTYEEISIVNRNEIKEYQFLNVIVKNTNSLPNTGIKVSNNYNLQTTVPSVTFTCKIIAYLHLLQLF